METNPYEKPRSSYRGYIASFILIAFGLLFLAKNLGWIDPDVFDLMISWPMLLVVWGMVAIFRHHLIGGAVAIGIGVYFLLPDWAMYGWMHTYWPLGLIVLGLIILLKRRDNRYTSGHEKRKQGYFAKRSFAYSDTTQEGYVYSDVSFSNVKHIVLDPVFRGGRLDISCGGVVLDLRRTALEAPETVLHIHCSFGGVELYIPEHWLVRMETDSFLSGCDDHRGRGQQIDSDHVLILRGDLTCSGIQIKS